MSQHCLMYCRPAYLYTMRTTQKEVIPSYSLSEVSASHNNLFEIVRCELNVPRLWQADFLAPHRRNYYMFVLVSGGGGRHWVDMALYQIKPKTFYLSSPHQIHQKEGYAPLEGIILAVTNEFLHMAENRPLLSLPIIENQENAHELILSDADFVFLQDVTEKMFAEYTSANEWRNTMLQGYLKVLLTYTSRLYTQQFEDFPGEDRLLLRRFKKALEENFTELHLVADYAQLLNISAGHLSDVVKQQSGKTAIELIHERILLEAKRQLVHAPHSVKEIAFSLGFEEASYFNRFFKRLSGQTPATFRNVTREMYH